VLAFGQVLDSDIASDMFDWTPPILITGWFYLAASTEANRQPDITVLIQFGRDAKMYRTTK
jgi:hypothetical protein